MSRFIFAAGSVTSTGSRQRLIPYSSATSQDPVQDLAYVGAGNTTGRGQAHLVTDAAGAYDAFVGPEDVTTLYLERPNGARVTVTSSTATSDTLNLSGIYGTKERLLRAASAATIAGSLSGVSPLAPTVTVTHTGSTTLAGSQRITPMRNAAGTLANVTQDPHFSWAEGPEGKVEIAAGDAYYGAEMVGGTAGGSGRRWNPRLQFVHDGSAFEVWFRSINTLMKYRIWVDGLPLSAAAASEVTTNPENIMVKVDFGSAGTRHIEIESNVQVKGVFVSVLDTVRRGDTGKPIFVAFGDSHTAGANGVAVPETWAAHAGRLLGWEWANLGVGGSAFDAVAATEPDRFRLRIPDIVAARPDAIAFLCGANDVAANDVASFQAEATYVLGQIKAQLPTTVVVVFGLYHTNAHAAYPAGATHDAALQAAAAAVGYPFYSFMDGWDIVAGLPAWAVSTQYWQGQYVQHLGYPYMCHTFHTSASSGSIDLTKFRPATIWRGTGKDTATTGDGANDLLLSSDGLHLTARGHRVMGKIIAGAMLRAVQS